MPVPLSGNDVETVELKGDSESHTLGNVRPDTEYIVTVIALYNGETEGPAATTRFKIGIKHTNTDTSTVNIKVENIYIS